ncbi:nuclear pore complex subunit [Pyrenophora seminiperda CCB06]|uniref:Nuclear pore complex subunit n=1 Tax=Pyrenophora seminiperda CCB06 TaxID=1302712 RepID=A0A3M7M439_9PLEO|nr:nuclear pore complex subunit [Pyrenophora seminiperda CCB06]
MAPFNQQGSEEPTPSPARSLASSLHSPIMFSPEASMQSARSSLRNPRRRQRKDSDGPQQQRSRKRSKLNDESFKASPIAHMNGNGSALMNGHAVQSPGNSVVLVDMPVREKKPAPKRASKEDTGLYLTKNANYSVKKLPGFPSALLRPSTPIYATALPSAGLALALTHERALVWDYSAPNGPTNVISLNLNFGLKASEPLPLGAIVRNGPTNDYGVVALAPSTGKIGFWENIDSADTRSLYPQRQQGIEGYVKLYSGETITGLEHVDHAGYVLVFSSGRLAQLTLRDSQGRPSVTITFLSAPNDSGGSFLSSFKGLLSSSIRKSIASVKARTSQSKGHMHVISATRNGLFQMWDLSWSGQHSHQWERDVNDAILFAVQARTAPEIRDQQQVHVLDFAIMDAQHGQEAVDLLVLVALSGRDSLDYFLLQVDLSGTDCTVTRTIPIRNFHQPQLQKEPTGMLLVPQPGHTAYVQFPEAMFVTSLAQPQESPEAQLLADSGSPVLPFQDTVYFHPDVTLSGNVMDTTSRKDKRATALIFVQQFGILEISALPPPTDDEDKERLKVTARSKLEQATFFSTIPGTVIDFSVRSRFSFAEAETAQAALTISAGILSSSYEYQEKAISNMDEQFQQRATALRTLISQLQTEYPPMSYETKWQLLWHAEKLTSAHKLWSWYQDKLQDQQANPDAYPENILMSDIVRALNERYKTAINQGMKLAEQYHDMSTLVKLIWEESNWLESEKANTRSKMEQAESTVKLNRIKERIARYFEMYGDDWADAFYSKYIHEGQAGQLFAKDYLNQPALTRYLRAEPSRVRLGWINEFGQGRLRDRPAHQSILRQGFESLVRHQVIDPALMIDILTLMNADDTEEGTTLLQGDEFIYAFRVLVVNWHNIHRTTRDGLHKLVWKRLLIKDDWATINNTKEITDAKINEVLQDTALVYTFRVLGRLCGTWNTAGSPRPATNAFAAGNGFARVAWPKSLGELLGAGGTHGELCVRFAAEDLREPIIKDNLLDDDTLREYLDKNRLADWFKAAYKLAKAMSEPANSQNGSADTPTVGNGVAPETAAAAEAELDQESAGSETFDGDDESAQDHDVEMRDL